MTTRKKAGRKSNEMDYEERVVELYKWMLLDKLSYNEFIKKCADTFGVTQRTGGNWWADLRERLKDRYEQETSEIINEQIFRYFNLYELALSRGNTRVAREILSDLNKIFGIEKASKVDVTSDGKPININIILDK